MRTLRVMRCGLAGLLAMVVSLPCAAEIPDHTVRIGVLTDMGGANADSTGEGSVVAARLAAEDAAAVMPGITVSVIGADHQNKADVASSIARDWIANQAINVITDVPVSSAGLAVAEAARGQKRTVFLASGTGASDVMTPVVSRCRA